MNGSDDLTFGHGTYITDSLGKNEVRFKRGQPIEIDLVHAAVVAERRANGLVDLAAREPVELRTRSRQAGTIDDGLGIVTAMRDPDESIFQSERTHNLGSTRQQRHNSPSLCRRCRPFCHNPTENRPPTSTVRPLGLNPAISCA